MSSFASSYIKTSTAAVARNADVLSAPSAGIINNAAMSVIAEVAANNWTTDTSAAHSIVSGGSGEGNALYIGSTAKLSYFDGTAERQGNNFTGSSSIQKVGMAASGSSGITALDGTLSSALTFDGDMGIGATFYIGVTQNANFWFGPIKSVKIYRQRLSDAQLQALTT